MLYATGLNEEDMNKPQVKRGERVFSLFFLAHLHSLSSRPGLIIIIITLCLSLSLSLSLSLFLRTTKKVGISSVWYEGNPCNMHLMDLAAEVKRGVEDAGMVGYRFNTIGVSDGISMGTDGMSFSLQSRDLIADSIETVMGAQW